MIRSYDFGLKSKTQLVHYFLGLLSLHRFKLNLLCFLTRCSWYKSTLLFVLNFTACKFSISSSFHSLLSRSSFHISLTYLFTIDFFMCLASKWDSDFYKQVEASRLQYSISKHLYKTLTSWLSSKIFFCFVIDNFFGSLTTTKKITVVYFSLAT